jgi:hypothetical protein
MPRNDIPVDVLLYILDYVDKAGLATMCRVSKICCSCSQDVLYRDIRVETPIVYGVQQTLAQSTHLSRRVRSFSSRFTDSDLAMALLNMTSLRILKLINMDIPDGCTFKLDAFECDYVYDRFESLQKFLSSQPSLKYVTCPMDIDPTELSSLEANCLPNLTRINATYDLLPYLIPGRPLNEVILDGYRSYEHSIDWSFFALSTTPIQKLTIDYYYLYSTPIHLLESFLPSLTHFTLSVQEEYSGVCGLTFYLFLDIEQHGIGWT